MQQLEFLARSNHEGQAVLVQTEHLPMVSPWRRGEMESLGQPFTIVKLCTSPRVKGAQEPTIIEDIEAIVINERGGIVRCPLGLIPRDGCAVGFVRLKRDV